MDLPTKFLLENELFQKQIKDMLSTEMMSKLSTDVILICADNAIIETHKFLLAACSPFLKDILSNVPSQNDTTIHLANFGSDEVGSLLQFIYEGETTITHEKMDKLLNVSKLFQIEELSSYETAMKNENIYSAIQDKNQLVEEEEKGVVGMKSKKKKKGSKRLAKNNNLKSQYYKNENGKEVCKLCNKQFATKQNARNHILSIHEGVKYTCKECNKEFTQYSAFRKHIRSNHSNENMEERKSEYKHEDGKHFCNDCKKEFTTKQNVIEHIQSIHKGIKYNCNECDKQFRMKSGLRIHMRSKHKGIKYPCNECMKQCDTHSQLRRHMLTIHKDVNYVCTDPLCDYQSVIKDAWERHMKSKHEQDQDSNYSCNEPSCDYQSVYKRAFKRHLVLKHKKISPSRQKKQGKSKRIIKKHQCEKEKFKTKIQKTLQKDKKYACVWCDYQTNSEKWLAAHIQSKHRGTQYTCSQCDYMAIEQGDLNEHTKYEHEGGHFKCNQCRFQADEKEGLIKHIQSEHDVKFSCNVCKYEAPTQYSLTVFALAVMEYAVGVSKFGKNPIILKIHQY